jgi:hypothetical protein
MQTLQELGEAVASRRKALNLRQLLSVLTALGMELDLVAIVLGGLLGDLSLERAQARL